MIFTWSFVNISLMVWLVTKLSGAKLCPAQCSGRIEGFFKASIFNQNFGMHSEEHVEKQLKQQRDRWRFAISQLTKETLQVSML